MPKITAKRSAVRGAHDGWEDYLREQIGLREGVTLERVKDKGMHGSVAFVFSTPEGEEVRASGYISSGLSRYYKMTVSVYGRDDGPDRDVGELLFGVPAFSDELKERLEAAADGY